MYHDAMLTCILHLFKIVVPSILVREISSILVESGTGVSQFLHVMSWVGLHYLGVGCCDQFCVDDCFLSLTCQAHASSLVAPL